MNSVAEDILMHYGVKRRSGRYPWGSGEDPYQHGQDFISRVDELKKQGWTETPENIKDAFGLTTTQYRIEYKIAKDERKALQIAKAKSLKEDGLGASEIGRRLGVRESTVRGWLDGEVEANVNQAKEIAAELKKHVDEKRMIDVGGGVERELGISKEMMKNALYLLEREGYGVYTGGVPQVTNKGQQTIQKVLCAPDIKPKGDAKAPAEIYDYANIHTIKDYISRDGGKTLEKKFTYPESMDSKRLQIRYNEDGGVEKDGIVELRRGVADLSLGESRYSQVRILVDGTHYIKGMAVYSDAKDWPDGVDVVFNTNKKRGTPTTDVLKKIKNDPDNPFGSTIKDADQGGQYWYDPKTGKRVSANTEGAKLGLVNKRSDQGDWSEWKDALPSQFLGKQSRFMAKKQLDLAKADKQAEFDEICSLTNPTVKKYLLGKFADSCDAAAVGLQAAALPGQKYHVIVPINSLKDNEIYAPNYEPGTQLALIRYPHGGTFEIPICTVTHKNKTAKDIIGPDAGDAVGINARVAERLSGADFDGDTVMCIPTHDKGGKVKIKSTNKLKDLEGFDPKAAYQYDTKTVDEDGTEHYFRNGREFKVMKNTGTQMGIVSNLITDMTLANASEDKLARAVKHSMVVIDAEKHKLDWKQSERDNDIESLRKEYQVHVDPDGKVRYGGASTILSRSKGETSVTKRQGTPKVNQKGKEWYDPTKPEGSLIYKDADDAEYSYVKKNKRTGEETIVTKTKTQPSTRMAETDDAYSLLSDARHPMEIIYADYANDMKALANKARLAKETSGKIAYNPRAKEIYSKEVQELLDGVRKAELNNPRERAAQRMANVDVANKKAKYEAETGQKMKPGDVKKISQQALTKYRQEVDTTSRKDRSIKITDRQWEAIQAGAISETKLNDILKNTDVDVLRERATPRTSGTSLSTSQVNRMKRLADSNYTLSEIANKMGVSPTTVSKYLKGAN